MRNPDNTRHEETFRNIFVGCHANLKSVSGFNSLKLMKTNLNVKNMESVFFFRTTETSTKVLHLINYLPYTKGNARVLLFAKIRIATQFIKFTALSFYNKEIIF